MSLPKAIICDLDGTLSLNHRRRNPYDASNCLDTDDINTPVLETVKALVNAGYELIFVSGREDKYRESSEAFIKEYIPAHFEWKLYMRKSGDFRKDSIVKEEIFDHKIDGYYNVLLVLDDRNSVVDQWRMMGLTCYQVAPGDF